jgi:hypothetical protein
MNIPSINKNTLKKALKDMYKANTLEEAIAVTQRFPDATLRSLVNIRPKTTSDPVMHTYHVIERHRCRLLMRDPVFKQSRILSLMCGYYTDAQDAFDMSLEMEDGDDDGLSARDPRYMYDWAMKHAVILDNLFWSKMDVGKWLRFNAIYLQMLKEARAKDKHIFDEAALISLLANTYKQSLEEGVDLGEVWSIMWSSLK